VPHLGIGFIILYAQSHTKESEEYRLLGYENPVHTSQETNYISATDPSWLMLCKIWGFHGGDYEEYRLLGYETPVHTSQETNYISVQRLAGWCYVRFEAFTAVTMKNAFFWDRKAQFLPHRKQITSPLQRIAGWCYVRFEVFTAVTMKNVVFWDMKTQFIPHRKQITSPYRD
jgi:hypothetical protein